MRRRRSQIDNCALVIESGAPAPGDATIVERKGWGHPDTLADHLAERLSRVYGRYTLERFGAVLHHNFDKLALLGGACEVRYGSGRMTAPARVLVNGRAARSCAGLLEDLRERQVRLANDTSGYGMGAGEPVRGVRPGTDRPFLRRPLGRPVIRALRGWRM
jgi:S-adenosylmethionine synthetase